MNKRQRKKYRYVANRCAHSKTYTEEVPYCDYYIPREYFICARQPKYTGHFSDELETCALDICEKCKSFTLSRETMRLGREMKDEDKWADKHYDKIFGQQ